MTENKETKEKWYDNDVVVSAVLVLGLFGITFLSRFLGASAQVSAYIFIGGFFCLIGLVCVVQGYDFYKWIRSKPKGLFK